MTETEESQPGKKRLEVVESVGSEDETCKTFVFHNEDHTLGNALRYIIMKNPNVQFCGYSVPHPSENKINFRIQTNGEEASEVLKQGLEDLNRACDHVLEKFKFSVADYKQRHLTSSDVEMGNT